MENLGLISVLDAFKAQAAVDVVDGIIDGIFVNYHITCWL